MPIADPTCASISLPVTSPIAQIPGTFVCIFSLISTMPRSLTLTPTASSPSPLLFGVKAVATSTWSTSRVSPGSFTLTFAPETPIDSNFTSVLILIPRLVSSLVNSLLTSSSSRGKMRGNSSMIVTSTPYEFQIVANSTPIDPPPTITTEAGRVSCMIASTYVTIFFPSIFTLGSIAALAPVATMKFFALSSVTLPSLSVTFNVSFDLNMADPMNTAILFLRIRNPTPLTRRSEFCRERLKATP